MSEFDEDAFLEHIRIHRNESKIEIAKWAWREQQSKIEIAKWAWREQQTKIDQLKAHLINMEQCYIEKKKQVEAANTVLINWQDEYTEHTHQHECTTDAVLRTCIAELRQALRGEHE